MVNKKHFCSILTFIVLIHSFLQVIVLRSLVVIDFIKDFIIDMFQLHYSLFLFLVVLMCEYLLCVISCDAGFFVPTELEYKDSKSGTHTYQLTNNYIH